MYGMAIVLVRTTRTAHRAFVFVVVAVCALALEEVIIGVVSTQYDVIVSPSCAILLSNYDNQWQ